MTGEYRILRVADGWHGRIGYSVQIKKRCMFFSWWEYIRDEACLGEVIIFADFETAEEWAKEFLKGKIAKEDRI